jgi:hypothetical protein
MKFAICRKRQGRSNLMVTEKIAAAALRSLVRGKSADSVI